MKKIDIYKNRIISVILIILFIIGIFTIIKFDSKELIMEDINKKEDKIIIQLEKTRTVEDIKEEKKVNNTELISQKIDIINKKYDVLKLLIPSDYNEISTLDEEIKKLNSSLDENQSNIALVDDIFEETLNNLNLINTSLNNLIEIFGQTNENMIIGTISEISSDKLSIVSQETIYTINIDDLTIIDGELSINKEFLIICDEKINENNKASLIIQK